MGFFDLLFKKNDLEKPAETKTNHQYPLEELGKLEGRLIEVYYLCGDEEKAERSILKSKPSDWHFYIGHDNDSHVIQWNQRDVNGRSFAVRMIKDSEGKIIYENQEVPYNFNKPPNESKQNNPEPSDTLSHAPAQ